MKKKYTIFIVLLFLLVELVLGYYAQVSIYKDYYRFTIVVLAFIICFVFFKKDWIYLVTQLALLFTLIADYFLIILDDYYLLAMFIFLPVQILYSIRIFLETNNKKLNITHFYIRVIINLIVMIMPFLILKENVDGVSVVSIVYFCNLFLNAIFASINYKKYTFSFIFAIGLTLFVFCDIFVFIMNLETYFDIAKGSFAHNIIYGDINFSWVFYTPSQSLLAISLIGHKYNNE